MVFGRSRGLGLRLEYGYHAVPMQYASPSSGVVVHDFLRWEPVVGLSMTF